MADIVKVDNKTFRVAIKKQDEIFQVLLNSASRQVEVAAHDGPCMTLIIDDKPYAIVFTDDHTIVIDNQEYSVEIFDEQVARLIKTGVGKSKHHELVIKAAMPGLIVELGVKEGDEVKEGQGLLIIEAMKMQNEMQSTRAGIVKKINIKKGQTVNSGDKLIIIE